MFGEQFRIPMHMLNHAHSHIFDAGRKGADWKKGALTIMWRSLIYSFSHSHKRLFSVPHPVYPTVVSIPIVLVFPFQVTPKLIADAKSRNLK